MGTQTKDNLLQDVKVSEKVESLRSEKEEKPPVEKVSEYTL
jgi:hypothetical protein